MLHLSREAKMSNYVLRAANDSDIITVAKLLQKANAEVFPTRKQSTQLAYEFSVMNMLEDGTDIILSEIAGKVTGVLIGRQDTFYNMLSPNYLVFLVYVETRHTKASYLLYHWAFKRAKEVGIPLETYAVSKDSRAFAKRNEENIVGYILKFEGK